jgi:Ca2+-binding RTX toxin-like protein
MFIPIQARRTKLLAGACAAAALSLALAATAQATVTATVDGAGLLTASSDAGDGITVTCTADATPLVKVNDADPSTGQATCASLTAIDVTGGPQDNAIDLRGVADPAVALTLPVTIRGGAGNDIIVGSAVNDQLLGEDGNDELTGFRRTDTADGGPGDDRMIWDNGDGSDVNEGGDGADTAVVNGSPAAGDAFEVRPGNGRVAFARTNLVPFTVDIGTSERLLLDGLGGDDTMNGSFANGLAALIATEMRGGEGHDTLTGTDGADLLGGGPGNDSLTGFRGADTANGEDGDDRMIWNNGDGSDVNEGGNGADTAVVNGAGNAPNDADAFTVRPNGDRVRFDRTNLVPFFVDIGSTEQLLLDGLAGDDTMDGSAPGLAGKIRTEMRGGDGNDALTGTDGDDLLGGGPGNDRLVGFKGRDDVDGGDGNDTMVWNNGDGSDSNDGEGGEDIAEVNGATPQGDIVTVKPAGADRVRLDRTNLVPFFVDIGSTERLDVNGGGGDDVVSGATGLTGRIVLDADGQDGNDSLRGGDGPDTLAGGDGRDVVRANGGQIDQIDCGAGRDRARVDRDDRPTGCEAVNVLPDRARPRITVRKTVTFSGSVLRARVTCPRSEFSCTGTLSIRRRDRVVGTGRFRAEGAQSVTVRIRATRAGRRLLRGVRRAAGTARSRTRDASGNTRTRTVQVRLRRS